MRSTAVLFAFATLFLSCSVQAQSVMLTPSPEGVTAEYRLAAPTTRVRFADTGIVRTDWAVGSPDLTLDAGSVTGEVAVDRMRLLIRPDSTEDGRGYISLTRLGDGYVLHAPSLTLQNQTLDLDFSLPEGWTTVPQGPFDGYIYLGPESAVTARPGGALHIATAAATPVISTLFDTFDVALGFFAEQFGPLPRSPILSVTRQGTGPSPFRGDVTDSGMISVRLNGDLADSDDRDILVTAGHVAFHETSHLWNGHLAVPAEGSPWLHEGGAEYLALVGAVSTGRIDEDEAREGLAQRLNDCRGAVADRPDVATRISSGSASYACGTVIQWFADMELRRGGEPSGVVAVWRDIIDRARQGRVEYSPADLTAAVGPSSAVMTLLEGAPETRWARVDTALKSLGVGWQNRPSSQSLITATLTHLNRQACPPGASRGFSLRDGYVELGNDATCGPLAGDIAVASVEGHDVLAEAAAMFASVQDRCSRREPVTVIQRTSNAVITVPCVAALTTPVAYDLTDTPSIGLPSV